MDPKSIAFAAYLGSLLFHYALSASLFVWLYSRKVPPIRGHSLRLVLLAITSWTAAAATNAATYIATMPAVPCWARLVLIYNLPTTAIVAFIARAWRIYYHYQQQAEQISKASISLEMPSINSSSSSRELEEVTFKNSLKVHSSSSSRDDTFKNMGGSSGADIFKSLGVAVHLGSSSVEERSAAVSSFSRGQRITGNVERKELQSSESVSSLHAHIHDSSCTKDTESDFAWYSDEKLVAFTLAVSLVLSIVEDIPFFVTGSVAETFTTGDAESCASYRTSLLIIIAIALVAMLFLVFTTFKLRLVKDGYRIKTDLQFVTLIVLAEAVLFALPRHINQTDAAQFFFALLAHMVIFSTSSWKVYHALKYTNAQRLSVIMSNDDRGRGSVDRNSDATFFASVKLCDVLANHKTKLKFRDHLKAEWSSENLLFYDAVHRYREVCAIPAYTDADCRCMVSKIVSRFIVDDSPSWVNLSWAVRSPLLSRVENLPSGEVVPVDLFDDASAEVFALMESDSFRTFKHKNSTKNLLRVEFQRHCATIPMAEKGCQA